MKHKKRKNKYVHDDQEMRKSLTSNDKSIFPEETQSSPHFLGKSGGCSVPHFPISAHTAS